MMLPSPAMGPYQGAGQIKSLVFAYSLTEAPNVSGGIPNFGRCIMGKSESAAVKPYDRQFLQRVCRQI